MTTAAKQAIGTQLQYGDDGSGWTTIAEVTAIHGPGLKRDMIDVTSHDSIDGWREFVAGLADGGEVTFDINFLPADTTQKAQYGDLAGASNQSFRICWPDFAATTKTFTADAGTDVLTAAGHGVFTGQPVTFSTSGALPAPLEAGRPYFIYKLDDNTFNACLTNVLSLVPTQVDLTSAGTGTQTMNVGTTWEFSGKITGFEPAAEVDAVLRATLTIKLTGVPSFS